MARDRRERNAWAEAADVGSVGLEMAIAVALGFFGGRCLDGRLDTAPAFVIVGVAFGVLIAGRAVWRVARRYMREDGDHGGKPGSNGKSA